MAEQIKLHSFRKEVDSTYVGFTPNGGSIKPVHVANGVQRCIFGGFNTAMQIKRLALVSDAKGNVPTGSELETIYAELAKNEAIEDGIAEGSVESMRNVMQRLLSADKGVYVVKGLKDDMIYRNGDIIERAQGYLIEIEELDKIVDDVIHGRI